MRVAYLTAGAGGMYCGSCMRDNTLAAALIRQKRDVTLIPVYSPIRVDEPDVSTGRVYYGGINVFLQQKSAFFRNAPRVVDRLLDAPRLLEKAMRRAGSARPDELGPLTLSILRGAGGAQRKELDKLIDGLRDLSPDLIHLPNAMFVGLARPLHEALGAAIACTLTGEDIFLEDLPQPYQEEAFALIRSAVSNVHGFIAVTRYYADYSRARFGIPEDRLHHVPMGIRIDNRNDPVAIGHVTEGKDNARTFTIGYLARICPEKGLHVLCDAFARLRESGRVARLKIAGYLPSTRQAYLEQVMAELERRGHSAGVEVVGEVDRAGKANFLRSCDVVSVPTVYREAKGLYVLEAMSYGVPVIQPAHGSFPELLDASGGGVLFTPEAVDELAAAIARLMDEPSLRSELGEKGRRAVRERFTDEAMAHAAWDVLQKIRRAVVQ